MGDLVKWLTATVRADRADLLQAIAHNTSATFDRDYRRRLADAEAKLTLIDVHDEQDEPEEGRHGHWEGWGSNEHWVRDEPNVCPICDETVPCRFVGAIVAFYRDRDGYKQDWKP